jgi:hypothetical protein
VLRHSTVTAVLAVSPRPGDVLPGSVSTLRRGRGSGDATASSSPPARIADR